MRAAGARSRSRRDSSGSKSTAMRRISPLLGPDRLTPRNVDLVSKRVGNYQHHPLFGVLLDQLWVK